MISLETDFTRIGTHRPSPDPRRRGLDAMLDRLEDLRMDEVIRLPKGFLLPEMPIADAARITRLRARPIGVIYDFILDRLMDQKPLSSLNAKPPLYCEHCGSEIKRRKGRPPRFCYLPAICRVLARRGIEPAA